jgi:hypothetical protein
MLLNIDNLNKIRAKTEFSYHTINVVFGMVILLIFLYSAFFQGNNHPIPALLTDITGEVPPSKGLSSSFSEIVRGNFDNSHTYNPYGIRVFSFFALQILFRVFFSIIIKLKYFRIKHVLLIDISLSIALFAWCFAPLIAYTFRIVYSLLQGFG